MKHFFALVFVATFALVIGCSSSDGKVDSQESPFGDNPSLDLSRICVNLAACGVADAAGKPYTTPSCIREHAGWMPPKGCEAAIGAADCIDAKNPPLWLTEACTLPDCRNVCEGQTLTLCNSAAGTRSNAYDCSRMCASDGQKFAYCGATYGSQKTDDGLPACWCF